GLLSAKSIVSMPRALAVHRAVGLDVLDGVQHAAPVVALHQGVAVAEHGAGDAVGILQVAARADGPEPIERVSAAVAALQYAGTYEDLLGHLPVTLPAGPLLDLVRLRRSHENTPFPGGQFTQAMWALSGPKSQPFVQRRGEPPPRERTLGLLLKP